MMTANRSNFQFDSVEVRPAAFQVIRDGSPLSLEPKAVRVLIYLVENRERAVSKDELLQAVWSDTAVTDNALTRIIAQLRRELGDDARQPRFIQTVPTLGYRFIADVRDLPAGEPAAVPVAVAPRGSRPMMLFAVGLFVTAGIAAMYFPRAGTLVAESIHATSRQFTTSAGLDFAGGFSPDDSTLLYASDRSGKFELYTRPRDGSVRDRQLTSDGTQNLQPAWSPDGQWIAYHSLLKGGIWVIPSDGGTPRQIVKTGSQPSWAPDSRRLVYRTANAFSVSANDLISSARAYLSVVDTGTGASHALTGPTTPVGRHAFPNWSRDGRRIVFSAFGTRNGGLWTIAPDGSGLKRIAYMDNGAYIFPVFGPDSRTIYYGAFIKSRDFGIWRIRLEGDSKPVEVIRTGTAIPRELVLNRDGSLLAYTSSQQSSHLWSLDLDANEQPAGPPKPLYTDTVYRTSFPVFSPDGSRIAFFARVFGGHGDIWTMNADGTGAGPLTSSTTTELLPSWTSDGKAIVYTKHTDTDLQAWRISVADRSEQPLLQGRPVQGWPRLSPDGKEMVWHDTSRGPMNIWKVEVASGRLTQLTNDSEGAGFPAWSPDGRWIAYELMRGPDAFLAIMNRDGSGQTQLHVTPGQNWAFSWSPDNRKILYAAFRDGEWNLYAMDRSTRKDTKLTNETSIARYVRYPSWSPDGRRIVYEFGQTRGNVFLVNMGH